MLQVSHRMLPHRVPEDRAPRRSVTLSLTVAALLSAAGITCGGEGPTPPPPPPPPSDLMCPSASVPLCTNPTLAAAARDGASDARGRSTPAIENPTARAALTTSLGDLDAALGAQNVTRARTALTSARDAITAARAQLAQFPGDAADLAAIELLLDQVATTIGVN